MKVFSVWKSFSLEFDSVKVIPLCVSERGSADYLNPRGQDLNQKQGVNIFLSSPLISSGRRLSKLKIKPDVSRGIASSNVGGAMTKNLASFLALFQLAKFAFQRDLWMVAFNSIADSWSQFAILCFILSFGNRQIHMEIGGQCTYCSGNSFLSGRRW